MAAVVVLFSLMSAFVNAVAIVMLRRAAGTRVPKDLFNRKIFLAIAKRKLFVAGVVIQLLGYLLQAVALNYGSILLVEPLLTTVLVFMVLILHYRYGVPTGKREWLAVAFACIGLTAMLIAARPHGGQLDFSSYDWIIAIPIIGACMAIGLMIMRFSHSANIRAIFGGIAVAMNIGVTAGLTKLVVEEANHGFVTLVSTWPLYAVIASGICMVVIHQSVYAAGPLVISQPIIEIVNPIVSGIIALTVFSSTISTSAASLAVGIPGLVLAIAGLAIIGSSKKFEQSHLNAPPGTHRII